jgi:pimeloyl-ACP methyl ester carboxylesterase
MGATLTIRSETLEVPGASLYYEVRGSGPVLLMMPGGPADAATFRRIEKTLAERHTVVTYDPRGLSHSKLTAPLDDSRMVQIFADDVHRLLARLGSDKADVFASSGGAVIALELAVRHPEQLRRVIAHEPPSPSLQPDPGRVRAAMEHVSDTFSSAGLWPAMQEFATLVGIQGGPPPQGEQTPEERQAMALMMSNMDFFIGRYVGNIARYEPDLVALEACPCEIVPAVGEESTPDQLARTGGLGLARVLGREAVSFPGDHGGFDGRPAEFAARLLEVLA